MNVERAEILLERIAAVVGRGAYDAPDFARVRDLAAKALAEPMTIAPAEIQELARAIMLLMPKSAINPSCDTQPPLAAGAV